MKSDCCFDEGRLVPGRIKRAAIVSFALMLLVAACVAALTYTVRSSSSSSNEADKDLPVLKIGVTDNDPYVYVDTTGDYAGIDIDIAREACERAGLKPQFVDIDWNDRDRLLENGDIDCLWCDYSPCYREDKYYWTEPVSNRDGLGCRQENEWHQVLGASRWKQDHRGNCGLGE